jgi:transglutaminase-like putative cysteine protease
LDDLLVNVVARLSFGDFPGRGLVKVALRLMLPARRVVSAVSRLDVGQLKKPRFHLARAALEAARPPLLFAVIGRRLTAGKADSHEKLECLFDVLRRIKGTEQMDYWPLPEEALVLPRLDCKGFATLFVMLAKGAGVAAGLVVGVDAAGKAGHAWAEAETVCGRMVYDFRLDSPMEHSGWEQGYICIVPKKS